MKEHSAQRSYSTVLDDASSALKACGYHKRRNSFRKDFAEVRMVLDFQKSRDSSLDLAKFTVNIGIIVKTLLDPEFDDIEKMHAHEGHLCWRIGDFTSPREDLWWRIESDGDPELIASDVRSKILEVVLQKLPLYSSLKSINDLLNSGEGPPMSEKQRRYLSTELTRRL